MRIRLSPRQWLSINQGTFEHDPPEHEDPYRKALAVFSQELGYFRPSITEVYLR